MIKWLIAWWRRRQRQMDVEILWPSLKKRADIYTAQVAFRVHMEMDPAYSDLSGAEKEAFVSALK